MTKPQDAPNPTNMLYELRRLLPKLDDFTCDTAEDTIVLMEFVRRFQELDTHVSSNGTFPIQWITKENQYQLKPHELNVSHKYIDPDFHKLGLATCGHREYSRGYCAEVRCSNYVQRHLSTN